MKTKRIFCSFLPLLLTQHLSMASQIVNPAAGGGSGIPIGGILQTPSAPSDGNTWLACNGATVSQATYSTLYGVIGQSYMQFTPTVGSVLAAAPGPSTIGGTWCGTYWMYCDGSTTAYYSSDAQTYTSTALNTAISAGIFVSYPAANTIIAYSQSQLGANVSTDAGATWSAHTLPATISKLGTMAPGNSTTNFLYVVPTSRTVYTMANGGVVWATNANALPASGTAMSTVNAVWWDGTNWNVWDFTQGLIYQTSVASGISGWTTATMTNGLPSPAANATRNIGIHGSTLVALDPTMPIAAVSTSSGTSWTKYYNPLLVGGSSSSALFWNGFNYVWIAFASHGMTIMSSSNGSIWHDVSPTAMFNSPIYSVAPSAGTANTMSVANTANGKMAFYVTLQSGGINNAYPLVLTPTPNTSTQFSLPNQSGYYIRAL